MNGRPAGDRSDAALVRAFVAGDDDAYAALVRRYQRRVFGICYRYFGDAALAEDAAQDAFVTLYRRAATFRGTSKFSTWMYRVATNACNDLARKQSRRPRPAAVAVEDLGLADDRDEIGQKVVQLELREALSQLDPDHRDAVVAHTMEGQPYHTIAARTGVAVGTIKSRVHRGHAKLAAILGERPGGSGTAATTSEPTERSGRAPPPT